MAQAQPMFVEYASDGTPLEQLKKKGGFNPFIPAALAVTTGVLVAGLTAFSMGNHMLSQKLMRARVLAQGATIVVLGVASIGRTFASDTEQNNAARKFFEFKQQ